MASPIPVFYRVWFTIIDPIFCIVGCSGHLFTPDAILTGYSPNYIGPPTPAVRQVLDSMAGFFALLGFQEAVLLRARANDLMVWRLVQASALILDAFMVFGSVRALTAQNRFDWAVWTPGEWQNFAGNVVAGLSRAAFLFGIGMSGQSQPKSKRR